MSTGVPEGAPAPAAPATPVAALLPAALLPAALMDAVSALGAAHPGATAAFDADGTLWRDDIGEAFLQHLCAIGWVKLAGGGDPYADYLARVERDRATGFAYAAQLQASLSDAALREECERFARAWVPQRLIPATQALLSLCGESGLACVVVSASPIQIVQAAAPLAGIPASRCLGMTTVIDSDGRVTDQLTPPITYAEGKVTALAQHGYGAPALGCGDSLAGDLALLAAARVAVAVAPASGSALLAEAKRRQWAVLVD